MNVFAVISALILGVILFWTIYHARILLAGARFRPKRSYEDTADLPQVSLIVPVKDEGRVIGRSLASLIELDYPKDKLEILVVDGASKDSSVEICRQFSEKNPSVVKLLCEDAPRGKPAALNVAFKQASGDIVGVFDADTVPEKSVLQKVVSYFKDKSVTAVQCRCNSLNEGQNMLTRITAMEDRAWFQGLLGGREKLGLFVPLTGSCQFVRSNVLKTLGGWDESALAEDVQLALKLTKEGYLVKYAPDIVAAQESPGTIRGLVTQRARWYRGYMEAAFKYGSLSKSPSRKNFDAEMALFGPFVMLVSLASYVFWALTTAFSIDTSLFPISAVFVVALTSVTLLSLGVSLVFVVKPVKVRNVLWVPFIYIYWLIQMAIAAAAFFQILFRRRRVWKKTVKEGLVVPISASGELSG